MPRLRFECDTCGQESFRLAEEPLEGLRCRNCDGQLRLAERRSGVDRRGPLQRVWDPESRSWNDRRQT